MMTTPVDYIPDCAFCSSPAVYGSETRRGHWTYMCESCSVVHSAGLNTMQLLVIRQIPCVRCGHPLPGEWGSSLCPACEQEVVKEDTMTERYSSVTDHYSIDGYVGSIGGKPFYCVELFSSSYNNWAALIGSLEIETPSQATQVLSAAQYILSAMTDDAYMNCGCVAPGVEQFNAV